MRGKKIIAFMLTAVTLFEQMSVCCTAGEAETVSISAENSFAVCDGWGTALYRWGERLGENDELMEQAAALLYGDDGLDMNIIRYNIGGGDSPEHSHFTDSDTVIPPWWSAETLDENSMSFTISPQDKAQIAALKTTAAAAGDGANIELYSFSPPYFMTESCCTAGAVYSGYDNIKSSCFDDHAKYLADVTAYLRKSGLKINSISPMNEPSSYHWKAGGTMQEGCHVSQGAAQSKLIEELRSALDKNGSKDVKIAAADEADLTAAADGYSALKTKAKKAVGRLNVHSTDKASQEKYLTASAGKNSWITEADGLYTVGSDAGEMSAALGLGRQMIADLTNAEASAWVMRQAVTDSGSGLGLIHENADNTGLELTQRYYAYGQFSRYIHAGSTLIRADENTIASYDMKTQTLSITALNCSGANKTVRFITDGYDILKSGKVSAVRTSGQADGGEHWQSLDNAPKLYRSGFSAELAPYSITTFTVSGVMLRSDGNIGDVNDDGFINVTDISLTAAHVKSIKALSAEKQLLADVNGDGSVNVSDIALIAAQVKGIRRIERSSRYTEDELLTDEETTSDM